MQDSKVISKLLVFTLGSPPFLALGGCVLSNSEGVEKILTDLMRSSVMARNYGICWGCGT